jgi:hypothetical protein
VLSGSDAERKDAIKQANGVFAFTLKNKAGETESWHVDLKESGRVGTGVGKPTGVFLSPWKPQGVEMRGRKKENARRRKIKIK